MKRNSIISLVLVLVLSSLMAFGGNLPQQNVIAAKAGARTALYKPYGQIPKPKKVYRIGVLLKTFVNDYFVDLKNGFQDAANKYGVQVEFFAAPGENDLLIQKQIMDDMLARNYDLICVNPITPSNLVAPCEKATQMGIPLINTNDAWIDPEIQKKHNIKILSFISTDWREQMRLQVRWIAKKLGPQGGEIMHIQGFPGSTAAIQRVEGYEEELKKFPQLKNVATLPGDWDRKKSMDIAADMIQAHPNLKVIAASNDNMALGAIQAVKNAGKTKNITVLGCDAIPDAIQSILKGELGATVAFMQYENGYVSIESAIMYLEGYGSKIPKIIYAPSEIWDKSNIQVKMKKYATYYSGLKRLLEK